MIIAQISDLHVRIEARGDDSADIKRYILTLETCVAKINSLSPRPEAVIVSGDIADTGVAGEYRLARKYLDVLLMPWFVLPGNHDNSEQFRIAFADHAYLAPKGEKLDFVVEEFPLRLIGLDSSAKGEIGGEITPSQTIWLGKVLDEQPQRPTFIFVHHPPVTTGMEKMDSFGFSGASELEGVICAHSQIKGLACGHIHRLMLASFGGKALISCPSLNIQLACTLAPGAQLALVREPNGFLLHRLDENSNMTSHFCYVEDFGGATEIKV